ncbi:MAG: hypothetical protein GY765_08160 [bacterium]|nr:hypothetical protein [bacterium]
MKNNVQTVSVNLTPGDIAKLSGSADVKAQGLTARITPINDKVSPTFPSLVVLKADSGAELLLLVAEIRKLLLPYEAQVFNWMQESPDNARQFIADPIGSVEKIGLDINQDTWDKIKEAGEMIKSNASAQQKNGRRP